MVLAIFIKDQPSNQKPKVEPSQARNFYSIHMAASVLGPLLGEATFFCLHSITYSHETEPDLFSL